MKKLVSILVMLVSCVMANAQVEYVTKNENNLVNYICQGGQYKMIRSGSRFYVDVNTDKYNVYIVEEGDTILKEEYNKEEHNIKKGKFDNIHWTYAIYKGDELICALSWDDDRISYVYYIFDKKVEKVSNSENYTKPVVKVLDGDFEIGKKLYAYQLEEDGEYEKAAEGVTYHIEQKDFDTAGKSVKTWFQKGGEKIFERRFNGKDIRVVQMKDGDKITYSVRDNNFDHAIIMKVEEGYVVRHYDVEL